jgi:hypothetical protein
LQLLTNRLRFRRWAMFEDLIRELDRLDGTSVSVPSRI